MALRFPTRDINSPAAAGVNCQEEGNDAEGANKRKRKEHKAAQRDATEGDMKKHKGTGGTIDGYKFRPALTQL